MNDLWLKILSGIITVAILGVAGAFFAMQRTIQRIEDQEPLREQLRAFELEQIRQGVQLNSSELNVTEMEIAALSARIAVLEAQP